MEDLLEVFDELDFTNFYRHICITMLCWLLMIVAALIDMWDAIQTGRQLKEPVESSKLRRTVTKVGDYWRMMLFGLLFDTLGLLFDWYLLPYMTIVITVGVLAIEFTSVWEHSKKRKSHSAELPDMIANIIKCASEKDALELIKIIKDKGK